MTPKPLSHGPSSRLDQPSASVAVIDDEDSFPQFGAWIDERLAELEARWQTPEGKPVPGQVAIYWRPAKRR